MADLMRERPSRMSFFPATRGAVPSPAPRRRRAGRALTAGLLACLALAGHEQAAAARSARSIAQQAQAAEEQDAIIATVNGSVLTKRDVDTRGRLFALSSGLDVSDDVMERLRPQIVRQLIDERLRMQEMLDRHINVPIKQIADAIAGIEQRNGMPENALRNKLAEDGVSLTTLIDQIRVQLGWSQVLRQETGERGRITAAEIEQRTEALKREDGKPEYMISEIFIPVDDPRHTENELKFTETIIQELREGAPFPIVAAQFSQGQSALEGGMMGWTQEDGLDPQVVAVARQMPDGAISNAIRVAGGYVIATIAERRTVGHQMATILSMRQAFFPFESPLDPENPTDQQKSMLDSANAFVANAKNCDQVEAQNKKLGEKHPSDPGELLLNRLNPRMREVLEPLPVGQPSQPLVSEDGIAVLMVCKREERNIAIQTPSEIADHLLNERVEQTSRQLNRDLQRRAIIDMRSKS
ncbi:Chaperone SurA precursor [Komagataeibacter saccharivorans]|uniref:Parvulin-like PPIase n=2 Tax=Acetobacteraceae TaxID=433 RepID=A0A347WCR8_9PROT|nr:peptidylprolyl isomerase [Komagataeibacter saccharivorans]AXY22661.1 Chaperone SurA precursor [Komagataeibacter saccharivorans]PMP98437.1 Peptidylprolyl isomerase [Komagataeibacter saccharivorans]PYD52012.1 peptidylprolyl isomerase [Komagataeibacter saccharivorans]QBL93445.1 Chaperone SurA [Komagataeibacter saccharivorans]